MLFLASRTPRTRHCVLATSRRGARPRRRTHVSASSFHPLPPRTACGACRASAAPLGLAHPLALVLPAAHWRLARRAEPTPPRPPPRALRRANRTQTSTPCRNIPTARRISAWRASDRRFRLTAAFRVDPSSRRKPSPLPAARPLRATPLAVRGPRASASCPPSRATCARCPTRASARTPRARRGPQRRATGGTQTHPLLKHIRARRPRHTRHAPPALSPEEARASRANELPTSATSYDFIKGRIFLECRRPSQYPTQLATVACSLTSHRERQGGNLAAVGGATHLP